MFKLDSTPAVTGGEPSLPHEGSRGRSHHRSAPLFDRAEDARTTNCSSDGWCIEKAQ
jgi:hypothetical protein